MKKGLKKRGIPLSISSQLENIQTRTLNAQSNEKIYIYIFYTYYVLHYISLHPRVKPGNHLTREKETKTNQVDPSSRSASRRRETCIAAGQPASQLATTTQLPKLQKHLGKVPMWASQSERSLGLGLLSFILIIHMYILSVQSDGKILSSISKKENIRLGIQDSVELN